MEKEINESTPAKGDPNIEESKLGGADSRSEPILAESTQDINEERGSGTIKEDKEIHEGGEKIEALESTIEDLRKDLESSQDKYVRTVAEMDNLRKRFQKEKADLLKTATESLLEDLLPILDSFDKAMDQDTSQSAQPFIEGVQMVSKQLSDVLGKHGLEMIEAEGKEFDPNYHQAIQRIESEDVTLDTVKQEFAKGYCIKGRLLRPSMVSVLVAKTAKEAGSSAE